ncbi:hypothetical protein HKCCE3408_07990 [Rhodobacterales bacterium HKCCE3408]|nr:hypothetical protein [Rhodobacterales bacterium HKCCE3408]
MQLSQGLRITLLAVLGGLIFAVLFSWAAIMGLRGQGGAVGQVALTVSMFPELVQRAGLEAHARISGEDDYLYVSVPRAREDMTGFAPLPSEAGETLDRFVFSGEAAAADRGWRLFAGAFAMSDGVVNGAVLVDPDFTIRRIWRLSEAALGEGVQEDNRTVVHGLQMAPNGDLLVLFDSGMSLQRVDACGGTVWIDRGRYHHTVSEVQDDGTIWALRYFVDDPADYEPTAEAFVQLDSETGAILREITVAEIAEANPYLALFHTQARDMAIDGSNAMAFEANWETDPFHFNDVEPLPASIADAFPGFEAGDLLVSARTLNTVFVLDPDTLEVKWHLTAATHRQHDPDWQADGTITIYDNRMGRGPSRIVSVDPATGALATLVDGAAQDFYSRVRGRQQITPRGDIAVVSPMQARAFEISDGARSLEFYNLGPEESDRNLVLTEFLFIPEAQFDLEDSSCDSR